MEKQNLAIIGIDLEVLAELLDLPDGHTIQRTICPNNDYFTRGVAKLVIQGPGMPEVDAGTMIPELPCWRNPSKGQIGFGKIDGGLVFRTKSASDKKRMADLEKIIDVILKDDIHGLNGRHMTEMKTGYGKPCELCGLLETLTSLKKP